MVNKDCQKLVLEFLRNLRTRSHSRSPAQPKQRFVCCRAVKPRPNDARDPKRIVRELRVEPHYVDPLGAKFLGKNDHAVVLLGHVPRPSRHRLQGRTLCEDREHLPLRLLGHLQNLQLINRQMLIDCCLDQVAKALRLYRVEFDRLLPEIL